MKKKNVIIIAEAGVNHNGKIKLAKKLIDIAKKSGADYIKFQAYKTEELVIKNLAGAKYQEKNLKKKINQFNLLKNLELKKKDYVELIKYSKKKKIKCLFSVFDTQSLEMLINLNIKEIKIPSGEIDNYPLLKLIAKKKFKVFLSTGMSSLRDIKKTLKIFKKFGLPKKKIITMHCNTDYPTNIVDVNLRAMISMKLKLKTKVGYSDHTQGFETAISSVALGAEAIEKHITISKKLIGPDHAASIEPQDFKNFVQLLRNTTLLLGEDVKKISKSEKKNKKFVKKSIVAKIEIKKGELFSEKNITCKRPAGGIKPFRWENIIGKKAKKNFKLNELIIL